MQVVTACCPWGRHGLLQGWKACHVPHVLLYNMQCDTPAGACTLSWPCCAAQDELIEQLGGVDKVAELTGRRKRMVKDAESGAYHYKLRAQDCPLDQVCSLCHH